MDSPVSPLARILIVDDEPALRQMLEILFRREGLEVVSTPGVKLALAAIAQSPEPFPVVLTDLAMPDGTGLEVLAAAKARSSSTEVVLITAHSSVDNAITAMRSGAYDFVTKPFDPSELAALVGKALEKQALREENARLRARFADRDEGKLVGRSPAMRTVLDLIERIARMRTTVLITGESGTGKERIARTIHERSEREKKPFLVVNCGALPEALMESELFGHEKGAFTGATARNNGIFREADGGTVLLDEVGELPTSLQVKLLRVLQEKRVRAVGASQETPIDVRVLAATNRDVESDVASGRFRQDLYYRLNVIRIELPALRTRREDVPVLTERFVRRFGREMNKDVTGLSAEAMSALERYPFPGNVRELENMIERAVALANGRSIELGDLPREVSGAPSRPPIPSSSACLRRAVTWTTYSEIWSAGSCSRRWSGRRGFETAAAKLLGITFRSLRYRLEKHGLDVGEGGGLRCGGARRDRPRPGTWRRRLDLATLLACATRSGPFAASVGLQP